MPPKEKERRPGVEFRPEVDTWNTWSVYMINTVEELVLTDKEIKEDAKSNHDTMMKEIKEIHAAINICNLKIQALETSSNNNKTWIGWIAAFVSFLFFSALGLLSLILKK